MQPPPPQPGSEGPPAPFDLKLLRVRCAGQLSTKARRSLTCSLSIQAEFASSENDRQASLNYFRCVSKGRLPRSSSSLYTSAT